ncbi:MAG: metalloregulator ArsR/SmtB family transcription factor [Bacteroidetes bacterium]|nr:metalloregulator ArsR/SmtB family transcription factor [Bacteroidota bacterium]
MTGREFKDLTFEQFAKIANAFSSPKRLEIIDILSQGERDVVTLAKETMMNFANASRHLQILRNSNLIKAQKEGVRVVYSLANNEVFNCWKGLQSLAEKTTAEIREVTKLFFEARLSFQPISAEELWKKLENDEVTLIDVRPKEEFASGHLPNAISIPLNSIKAKSAELSTDKEIVAYCRGPYCVLAAEAARFLNSLGYKVTIMKDDVNRWHQLGLQLEK